MELEDISSPVRYDLTIWLWRLSCTLLEQARSTQGDNVDSIWIICNFSIPSLLLLLVAGFHFLENRLLIPHRIDPPKAKT